MNLTPNEQLKQSSNNINNDSTHQNPEKEIKKIKRRKTPKTHNQQFNMQSIIHSVAGIGSGSANDFSFANIKTDFKTDSKTNIEKSIEKKAEEKTEKKVTAKKAISSTTKNTSNNTIKRSKKINKAKLQKVFRSQSFKHTHSTTKVMGGLIQVVKEIDRSVNAKDLVSELLIKWILKEDPTMEYKILQLLDLYLDAE